MRWMSFLVLLGAAVFDADSAVMWVGTASGEGSGIYRSELDLDSGAMTPPRLAAEIGGPGFLAQHPNGKVLYAACQLPGDAGGGVMAYSISSGASTLSVLNSQPTGDGGAAHLAVDPSGRCLFTAQYGGGSVAVFPVLADGKVGPRSTLIEHEGSGPNRSRQEGPHPHWVGVGPKNEFLFVPDLGIDRVLIYRIDHENASIRPHGEAVCPPGGGPRHFKFHPSGKWAYVVNELILAVTVFEYDAAAGALTPIQTIPALPEYYWQGFNSSSEIRVHPTGRFVYSANRGHDSVTVFAVDGQTGRLRFIEREAIRGAMPRNFNLDPGGRWLVAGGRESNSLTSFQVDQDSGALLYSRHFVSCPRPMCVLFQPTE